MANQREPNLLMPLLAGMLAWAIPGAGHVYLRRTVRGIILCICINGLFWAGMAFGGVFTVEPLEQRWWFVAQMCTGVSGLAGWYRQQHVRREIAARIGLEPTPPRYPAEAAGWRETFTRQLVREDLDLNYPTDNVARAYSGVAGMLNVLAIFDAVMLAAMGRLGEPPPRKPAKEPPL